MEEKTLVPAGAMENELPVGKYCRRKSLSTSKCSGKWVTFRQEQW